MKDVKIWSYFEEWKSSRISDIYIYPKEILLKTYAYHGRIMGRTMVRGTSIEKLKYELKTATDVMDSIKNMLTHCASNLIELYIIFSVLIFSVNESKVKRSLC